MGLQAGRHFDTSALAAVALSGTVGLTGHLSRVDLVALAGWSAHTLQMTKTMFTMFTHSYLACNVTYLQSQMLVAGRPT